MDYFSVFLILAGVSIIFYCYNQKIPVSLSLVTTNFIIFFIWWSAILIFDYDGRITWQDLGFNPLLTLNYSTLFSVDSFNLLTLSTLLTSCHKPSLTFLSCGIIDLFKFNSIAKT